MKRTLIASTFALTCSVGLAAQTPTGTQKPQSPTTTQEQPAQKSAQGDDRSATFRGCLRAGDETGQFVLTDASATTGATLKNARVQLVGSPAGMNLKDHVGHTVEVTGMLVAGDKAAGAGAGAAAGKPTAANPGSAAGAKPGATGGKPGAAGTGGAAARLNVKAVKHVKEGC